MCMQHSDHLLVTLPDNHPNSGSKIIIISFNESSEKKNPFRFIDSVVKAVEQFSLAYDSP